MLHLEFNLSIVSVGGSQVPYSLEVWEIFKPIKMISKHKYEANCMRNFNEISHHLKLKHIYVCHTVCGSKKNFDIT